MKSNILLGGPDENEPLRVLYISRCDGCSGYKSDDKYELHYCNKEGRTIATYKKVKKNCLGVHLLYIPKWCSLPYATKEKP